MTATVPPCTRILARIIDWERAAFPFRKATKPVTSTPAVAMAPTNTHGLRRRGNGSDSISFQGASVMPPFPPETKPNATTWTPRLDPSHVLDGIRYLQTPRSGGSRRVRGPRSLGPWRKREPKEGNVGRVVGRDGWCIIQQHLKQRVQQGTGGTRGMQGGENENELKAIERKDAAGFCRAAIDGKRAQQTIPSLPWTSNASGSTWKSTCRQAKRVFATQVAPCSNSWQLELSNQIDPVTAVLSACPARGSTRSQPDDKHAESLICQHEPCVSKPKPSIRGPRRRWILHTPPECRYEALFSKMRHRKLLEHPYQIKAGSGMSDSRESEYGAELF